MRRHLVLGTVLLALLAGCDTRRNPVIATLDGSSVRGQFEIRPKSIRLVPGQSVFLRIVSNQRLGPFRWTSNQPGVASVDDFGLVTAINFGVATITAISSVEPQSASSATVSVQPPIPTGQPGSSGTTLP